ncbi:hypothetical protein MHU86_5489 [Fragilaria crotonensis]|nr:hypothetical protein MHU86_5489 [Fragilaria crotonensis]
MLQQEQKQELPPSSFSSPIPKTVSIENGILGNLSRDNKSSTSSSRLEYGAATPGTMATTSSFVSPGDDNDNFNGNSNNYYNPSASPLGIFASFALSSSRALFGEDNKSPSEKSIKTKKNKGFGRSRDSQELDHDDEDEDEDDDADEEAKSALQPTPSPIQEQMQQEPQRLGISAPSYSEEDDESVNSADSNRIGIERTNYQIPEGDIPLSPMDPFLQKRKHIVKPKNDSDHDDDGQELWQLKLQQQANRMNGDTILEEDEEEDEPVNDSVERFLHEPTAQGRYLVNSRPLDAPLEGIQYPLTEGKAAMSPLHRQASKSKKLQFKTRPNVTVEQQQLQQRSPSSIPITSSPSSSASFKIFILLVAPKKKIFEIIQVFYAPLETTVHHLIQCIPPNATEPALATQTYIGMCRLDGQTLDVDMMASAASPTSQHVSCAKIIRGEVLVAIPKGYTAKFCSQIAKPILLNPKVTKLMKKSDPLAPSKKKKKKRSSKSSSSPKSKYKSIEVKSEAAALTSPYAARSTSALHQTPDQHERRLLKALQRGASEAESTNAEIYSSSSVIMTQRQLDDTLDIDAFDNDDQEEQEHHHLPMELWQTQMSFRSDSSSAASSVDSAFFGSPTSFVSPTFRRSSYSNNHANYSGGVAPIPEAHLESPTLGLDIEVVKTAEAPTTPSLNRGDATLNPTASPSPSNNNTMIDLATLQSTLANKDVHGAMEAFGKLLLQNSMLTPGNTTDQEQQNAIMAQLVRAVQQHEMER